MFKENISERRHKHGSLRLPTILKSREETFWGCSHLWWGWSLWSLGSCDWRWYWWWRDSLVLMIEEERYPIQDPKWFEQSKSNRWHYQLDDLVFVCSFLFKICPSFASSCLWGVSTQPMDWKDWKSKNQQGQPKIRKKITKNQWKTTKNQEKHSFSSSAFYVGLVACL